MTVTVTSNPADGSSISTTQALAYTIAVTPSGSLTVVRASYSTDGGMTYAYAYDSSGGGFQTGFTGTDFSLPVSSGVLTIESVLGYTLGVTYQWLITAFANFDGGNHAFSYTVTTGGEGIAPASEYVNFRPGHIDWVTPSHTYYDRIDVTDGNYLLGSYGTTQWLGSTLVNMQTIIGTPDKSTNVVASRPNLVPAETLVTIDGGGGSLVATLSFNSNHLGTYPQNPNTGGGTSARLYEVTSAGVTLPVPDSVDANSVQPWVFTTANAININAAYVVPSSTYLLDYDLEVSAATLPIRMPVDASSSVWLSDLTLYQRHDVTEIEVPRVAQLLGTTTSLKVRASILQPATVTADNGISSKTLNTSQWSFVDSKTVRLASGVFQAGTIYTIAYTALVPNITRGANATFQYRYAADTGSLASASWTTLTNNQVLTPVFSSDITLNEVPAYFQFKVLFTNIVDVRDVRLFGMGLKSIALFGNSPNAPGII